MAATELAATERAATARSIQHASFVIDRLAALLRRP
jgi:hypothetical protein